MQWLKKIIKERETVVMKDDSCERRHDNMRRDVRVRKGVSESKNKREIYIYRPKRYMTNSEVRKKYKVRERERQMCLTIFPSPSKFLSLSPEVQEKSWTGFLRRLPVAS